MSIFRRIKESLTDASFIWREEMKQMVKDEGVLIFFIIVPLLYPLLYSWIYNNEVVRDVPVAVVDESHSSISRQFIRQCDASPDVKIAYFADDLDEAKMLVSRQIVKGVYLIPSDFDTRIGRMQQATIGIYCDMSLMMTYKAIYQTAQAVTQSMNTELQTKMGGHFTDREEQISAQPLDFEEVAIFNPTGGYGSFILPGVLMLIIQQTLVLGIGLAAGTARENNRFKNLIPVSRHYHGMFRNPDDLPGVYEKIDIVLATYDATSINAQYAEPNKLYEAIYFRTPIVVSSSTFLAKKVKRLGIGYDINGLNKDEIVAFIENLSQNDLLAKQSACAAIPKETATNSNPEVFDHLNTIN